MNEQSKSISTRSLLGAALAALAPATAHAQEATGGMFPVEMNMPAFLIIGSLLLFSIILFFVFQTRFNSVNKELQDIAGELDHTRQRLTETSQTLDQTELNLKNTTHRYQGILFDAQVGVFQMDLDGKCTYINSALQELSGLYPKKALKEGLQSAIHPDDRERFNQAWKTFADGGKAFALNCRFKSAKGRETHVAFRANKVLNERKDTESYIGWVSDITHFHEEQLQQEAATARYARFVDETIEGYYQLAPEKPIPLGTSPDKMAASIMEKMVLVSCNETFAALYGAAPDALEGKSIGALPGGCGPLKNNDSIKQLIAADYKQADFESVRQDPRGNRLNLLNHVVGLVEDNKLVGIWGSQQNVTRQKREVEELSSQTQFMHRILDALPADVHVKDTRCRYLYASRKLADRTGIPQEDWVGKTIFEIMPATPRDHDKDAINVMKTGQLARVERPYETHGKSGWMETVQIPLVSDDGLVEGMVGLSLEISARKEKEEEARHFRQQIEQQLKHRTEELQKAQSEHGKTAVTLRDTNQKLAIREAELENHKTEFLEKLNERKQTEKLLRHNEETLLTHQKQLEKQLSTRLAELETETDKRKKWEELISIKEDELRKIEDSSNARKIRLEGEIAQRKQTEALLKTSQAELKKYRKELETLSEEHGKEVAALAEKQRKMHGTEHSARKQAEALLKKTETLLQKTQAQIKALTEQHTTELERETSERKAASKKLTRNTEELDELKHQFSTRIEQETRQLKKELAQKQIREKSLRQQEKDLEGRINELEKSLSLKVREHNKQIQAHEGSEAQRKQAERKLEHLNARQNQFVERETQKLNLDIAEIRLGETKLRKQVINLQTGKKNLEELIETRTAELENAAKELKSETRQRKEVEKELEDLQLAFEASQDNAEALVAQKTEELHEQVKQHKQNQSTMQETDTGLKKQAEELRLTIDKLTADLSNARKDTEKPELKLKPIIAEVPAAIQTNSGTAAETDKTKPTKCDLHELINDIDQQFSQRADTQKLFFAVSFAQYQSTNNVPKLVKSDGQKIREILDTLLNYALAHTEKGRLGLHASRKASAGNKITVAFELAYTGAEAKDELLGKVFGADPSDENDPEDAKYGLSLSRGYARMLGGDIALEYRQGGITALTIDLPFKEVEPEILISSEELESKVGAA